MTLEECKQEYKWRRSFLRAGLQGTPAQIDDAIKVALGTEEEYIMLNINNKPLPQYILNNRTSRKEEDIEYGKIPDMNDDRIANAVANHLEEMKKFPDDKTVLEILKNRGERNINEVIQELKEEGQPIGLISDGYHTFDELYEFRKVYNAVLFNEWGKQTTMNTMTGGKYEVHKSWKHSDGEWCFGEEKKWFIVSAMLPTGLISNHYKAEDWDLFKIAEVDKAFFTYDGHTGEDVLKRLKAL